MYEPNLTPLYRCYPGLTLRKFLLTIIFIPPSPWGSTRSSCSTSNELIATERSIFLRRGRHIQRSLHINAQHGQTRRCALSVLPIHKSGLRYRPLLVHLQVPALVSILPLLKGRPIHCLYLVFTKRLCCGLTGRKWGLIAFFILRCCLFHPHGLISLPTRAARCLKRCLIALLASLPLYN